MASPVTNQLRHRWRDLLRPAFARVGQVEDEWGVLDSFPALCPAHHAASLSLGMPSHGITAPPPDVTPETCCFCAAYARVRRLHDLGGNCRALVRVRQCVAACLVIRAQTGVVTEATGVSHLVDIAHQSGPGVVVIDLQRLLYALGWVETPTASEASSDDES